MRRNARGNYPVPIPGIELGLWHARYAETETAWMRWYTSDGHLVPISEERADAAREEAQVAMARVEAAEARTEVAEQRADRAEAELECLRTLLRQKGVTPPDV
jgi:hypothetical protein